MAHFHKGGGHPTAKNLSKIISDAGHPSWKIDVVRNHRCPACESPKPGGTSSKRIPPASATHPMYRAWQAVGMEDVAEINIPGQHRKARFIASMDLATKLRVNHVLTVYDFLQVHTGSADEVISAFSTRWLKPEILILDNAKSFSSGKFHEFCQDLNIFDQYVAEKEHWALGTLIWQQLYFKPSRPKMRILQHLWINPRTPRSMARSSDLHLKLTSFGAVPALGERCLWVWFSKHKMMITLVLLEPWVDMLMTFTALVMRNHQSGLKSKTRLEHTPLTSINSMLRASWIRRRLRLVVPH